MKHTRTHDELMQLKARLTRVITQAEELAGDELTMPEIRVRAMHACTQGTSVLLRITQELAKHPAPSQAVTLDNCQDPELRELMQALCAEARPTR